MMENQNKKAIEKAMALLLYKDRTKKELQERLAKGGFSEEAIQIAMEYVGSYGYIDDVRYARNYIGFRKEMKSRKEITYKLLQKGLGKEDIALAMEEYESEETALANNIIKKLNGRVFAEMDAKEREKLLAYLCRKGFSYSDAQRELSKMES